MSAPPTDRFAEHLKAHVPSGAETTASWLDFGHKLGLAAALGDRRRAVRVICFDPYEIKDGDIEFAGEELTRLLQ